MAVAVVATILPPMAILTAISFCYAAFAANPYVAFTLRGMQAGVAAVILDVVCSLGTGVLKERSAVHLAVMVCAFVAAWVFDVGVVYIILGAACVGVVMALARRQGGHKA